MESTRLFGVGLTLIVAIAMVLTAATGLKISEDNPESSQTGLVYLNESQAHPVLDGLGIEIIESYESFSLVRMTSSHIASLGRRGIEASFLGDGNQISMAAYKFDTSLGESSMPETLKAGSSNNLHILQFIGPIKAEWLNDVSLLGIELRNYIPNNAYLVRADSEMISNALQLRHVQWAGAYHPAYRISPEAVGGKTYLNIWNGPGIESTLSSIIQMCPGTEFTYTERTEQYETVTWVSPNQMESIASLDNVLWMEQYLEPELHDEVASEIVGGIWTANTPYGGAGNYANLAGWDGTNVVIAVADTGLGDGTTGNAGHVDFENRVVGGKDYGTITAWSDGHGHGTHCAGIAAADTYGGTGRLYATANYYVGMGVAPDAKLYAQKIFTDGGASDGIPTAQAGWDTFFNDAYGGGAYVHSNSWGAATGGAYGANDNFYDQKVRDSSSTTGGMQPMIITVSAGNSGSAANTIGTPGNAKNVITVGGVENYMPNAASYGCTYTTPTTTANNPEEMYTSSSRGLEDDSRIKPDILAPGTCILSTSTPARATSGLFGLYTPDNRYEWCTGTSQSNPHVAGGAAVITEWYQATYGQRPTPALAKALIINSAKDIGTADIPNGNEGWGRMYLPDIVNPPVNVIRVDSTQLLSTGQTYSIQASYHQSSTPLKVTLVWTDAPAIAGANPTLVNNLNLRITAPGGQVWYGNSFSNGVSVSGTGQVGNTNIAGEVWDANSDSYDDRNNMECIYIPTGSLQAGMYTIEVIAQSVTTDVIPGGAVDQDFALVLYNAAQQTTATATGPVGSSNQASVTLTYTTTMTPTSVNLYYTKSTSSPYTWVLAGNDASVDGSYSYTITAGSGTYGWLASAVGGGSTEPSPPANTVPPEATSYVLDITAPAAPTGLTVHHWGPSIIYGSPTTETRYLRGVANEATVNGLTSYSLDTAQSATSGNWGPGNNLAIYLGMRVYKRTSAGVETEISSGLVATVSRTAAGSGFQTATWTPPQTILGTGDSIVIKVYGDTTANPTTLRATFTTTAMGPISLDSNQWTVQYWTRVAGQPNGSDWYWGTTTYDNHIEGFQYRTAVPTNPINHNTLNWTHNGNDVDHYNIYRSDVQAGTYTLIGTSPVGTNTYCDIDKGQADTTRWWYRVRAEDAAGNIETNTNSVQEPGTVVTPPYAISMTGKAANSWVFVSFPSGASGAIQTLLNDATSGDGSTTWTVARWYNPQTPADPWKTYRVGGTANDMPNVNNTMGVWLWITANGGDQVLTLNSYVAIPASTGITLKAGWNLVGYPSMTNRLASTTLPGVADRVSVWSATSPYVIDYSDKSLVTMSHGNAYWVRVTADTTWTVTNP
jgi:hypothetical protein